MGKVVGSADVSKEGGAMFFKCSYEVARLRSCIADGLEFRFDKPKSAVVRLIKDYPDGRKPLDSTSAICLSETHEEPTDMRVLSDLRSGSASSLDGRWANLKEVSPATVEFLHAVLGELQRLMVQTVIVFAWREGLAECPPDPCRNSKGHYSHDGVVWYEVSTLRSGTLMLQVPGGPRSDPGEISGAVVGLVGAGIEDRLGHRLFWEAWNQRETNPRSSLVIGVAAAEVGFKQLVGSLVPHAQWLVDEVQTPSLSKMVRKFLPTLPVKARFQGKSICPPNVLVNKLDEAVTRRNRLVHAGQPPPSHKDLEEMLNAVHDFLWICDVYEGHAWAAKHISLGTICAWKDEKN